MTRTLVIGYGNPSRRDDGVGLAAINLLRARMGLQPLDEANEWLSDTGQTLDTLFQQQLTLELVETLARYDRVFLVDAHVGVYPELVHRERVAPRESPGLVSHILKPEHLLALAERVNGRAPDTTLYSVRGFDFNFGEQLSPATAEGVEQVIAEIWDSVRSTDQP